VHWLHETFGHSAELVLFLALALGYLVGKIRIGNFQLGGVAGSLLAAVILSQIGVVVDNGVKAILFALFIYAVGFESGPQFFASLGRQSVKEILLAVVLAISGLVTVVASAWIFHLDKGLAAGIAAGGLTQSAIIGTASDAIGKFGLAADEVRRLQGNVAIGYAVTYVFGSFGAILICANLLPWFMGRKIRDDAVEAETALLAGSTVLAPGQEFALPEIVGRLYRVTRAEGLSVGALETSTDPDSTVTIERVKRGGRVIGVAPELILQQDDILLVVGRRSAMLSLADKLGTEVEISDGMDLVLESRDVVLTDPVYIGRSLGDIHAKAEAGLRHGLFVTALHRGETAVAVTRSTVLQAGDLVTVHGTTQDVQRVAALIGPTIVPSLKTDFVYHGFGLALGLLIGLAVVRLGGIPLTLGSGGGALLSGLLFGWYRTRRRTLGNMPEGAVQILKDLGLAGFVAAVGLQTGLQAVETVKASGLSILLIGVAVTVLPLLVTMAFGRYVLRYENVAVFAGALSGSRSANPAFGAILDKAGNAIPTAPFAITYALANVFLTLLGPLIVALV
jgi:putative transport protein